MALVENDVSGDVWSVYPHYVSDIFQNGETVRKVLPEETSVEVEFNQYVTRSSVLEILAFNWDHWEWYSTISLVRVEDSLQARFVADLPIVHGQNTIFHRHNLVKVYLWVLIYNGFFDFLDLVIKTLDFVCASLIKAFVQKRDIFGLEHLVALLWELVKEPCDSSWVDDLITWAESQIQERWDRHAWDIITMANCTTDVMQSVQRKSRDVEILLWPNDVNILSIVDDLADEWHILCTEDGQIVLFNEVLTQAVHRLEIKCSLSKYCTDHGPSLNERSNLLEDLPLCVGW